MPEDVIQHCLLCLEKRFGFVVEDLHLLSATVLSPHGFKWLNIASLENSVLHFPKQEVLINLIKGYLGSLMEQVPPLKVHDRTSERPAKFQKVADSLFGYEEALEDCGASECTNWTVALDQHLLRTYTLPTTLDASAYWISQPKSGLQKVALMILAVPASSAPVERVFSHAGLVCSPKRTRMNDDLLSALVKAKYNCL